MSKNVRWISPVVVGYLVLLPAFVFLGLFVAALAYGSSWALAAGVGLVVTFAASVMCFRYGGRELSGKTISVWDRVRRQEEVDRYNLNFRAGQRRAQGV